MKRLLILMAILVPFIANSKTYFNDGMTWLMEVGGITSSHLPTVTYYTVTAEKSPNDDSLMMYRKYAEESDRTLVCYVKTEGEKVLFKPAKSEADNWYLLYDFGLQPGEGCYVYMPNVIKDNGVPHRTYVKCIGLNKNSGFCGFTTMTMEEYDDASLSHCYGKGTWIKGLSAEKGVLENNYFVVDGGYSLLLKAYDENHVIYDENNRTYFKDGMTWFLEKGGTSTPEGTRGYYTITAEKSPDDGSLMMFQSPYGESDRKLMCYVKTEGEKVYFKPEKSETDDWYLLYDFGLQPGEGCYVYMPNVIKDGVPHRTYVKCTGFNEYSGYYGMDTMTMEEYEDETCSELTRGTGIWIKGLGSSQGPLDNNYFEAVGGYSLLLKAYDGDHVIYERNMTWFKDGTKWRMDIETVAEGSYDLVKGTSTVTVEKSANDDTLIAYQTFNDQTEKQLACYMKAEGYKVYFRPKDSTADDWFLLYDFGMMPGDECYIYSPRYYIKKGVPAKSYVKCVAVKSKSPNYGGWNTMTMEEYEDEYDKYYPREITWIRGLSSADGVLDNGTFYINNNTASNLTWAYSGDRLIYQRLPLAIDEVMQSESVEIRIEGLNLYVTTAEETDGALYTPSGLHLGNYRFGPEPVTVCLPSSGIYILKAGGAARKIFIP